MYEGEKYVTPAVCSSVVFVFLKLSINYTYLLNELRRAVKEQLEKKRKTYKENCFVGAS